MLPLFTPPSAYDPNRTRRGALRSAAKRSKGAVNDAAARGAGLTGNNRLLRANLPVK